jgi:hypothetical protein
MRRTPSLNADAESVPALNDGLEPIFLSAAFIPIALIRSIVSCFTLTLVAGPTCEPLII